MEWVASPQTTDEHSAASVQFDPKKVIKVDYDSGAVGFALKRSIDVALTVLAFTLLAPLMLIISLFIVVDSHGPVIFSQDRVGSRRRRKNGQVAWETHVFRMHKFRSMIHNADQTMHQEYIKSFVSGEVEVSGEQDLKYKLVDDPRITRVGRMVRSTSLDELPQLFNILKGEMSLVGPRPVPVYEVAEYDDWHYERLAVLPGLTGLWQVSGRGNVSFDEMVRLDIEYVRSRSLWLDIKLLILTVPAVFAGRGAR